MTMARRAEIAGGGIAGLTGAAALAQRGWSVTIHERNPSMRAYGAGIFIWENGLRVLEAIGAYDDAVAGAHAARMRETRDRRNRVIGSAQFGTRRGERLFTIVRQQLLTSLRGAAERAGAEIRTNSPAVGATPEGELLLADGSRRTADLVIGADGVNSPVRDSLGLLQSRRRLPDGAIRMLIPRLPEETITPEGQRYYEYWSGQRRLLYVPCSGKDLYIALVAPDRDTAAKTVPIRKDVWVASFPHLASVIARLGEDGRWDIFEVTRLKRWSAGRVAIVGDAAHAQAPNLGQGGGCSMMGALGLAVALEEHRDVSTALAAWERRERPLVEHTQRFSSLYGVISRWPAPVQSAVLDLMHRSKWLNRQRQRTARHVPTGTA